MSEQRTAENDARKGGRFLAGVMVAIVALGLWLVLRPAPSDEVRSDPTAASTEGSTESVSQRLESEDTAPDTAVVYGSYLTADASPSAELDGQIRATGLSARGTSRQALADVIVILTSTVRATVDLQQASGDRGFEATVTGVDGTESLVERGRVQLLPDEPTAVLLKIEGEEQELPDSGEVVLEQLTGHADLRLPVEIGGEVGEVRVTVTSVTLGLDDLNTSIDAPGDVPDQVFDRPAPGVALPEQLDDGTPIWIVGLDEGVGVVGARSPHTVSGLVGWCGTLPGFIDSPGSSRFTADGRYQFGPAPFGLVPYGTVVDGETVTVTSRLAPEPRDAGGTAGFPPIRGSAIPQTGPCPSELDVVDEDGGDVSAALEDYRDAPGWVQHDLTGWPPLDGQDDGWYLTEDAETEQGQWVGETLIQRVDGVTVDLAAPPPGPMLVRPPGPHPRAGLLVEQASGPTPSCQACTNGSAVILDVEWVTPTRLLPTDPAGSRPEGPSSLVPTLPFNDAPLPVPMADGLVLGGAEPGELVVCRAG